MGGHLLTLVVTTPATAPAVAMITVNALRRNGSCLNSAGKDLAEIDFLPAQTDTPATGNHDGFIVQGIVDVRQSTIRTRGKLVDLRRALHLYSFVGTFVVEDLDKFVEARLLLKKISGGRLGGLFLQGQMHALMTPILLRMAGLDALNTDPRAEPPHRELAQVEQRMCVSERHTVIAADVGGQAALLKKPLKHCESVLFPGRRKGFTGEQITAGVIGDGQRITVLVITQQEFTFVIGAPQFIGLLTQR